MARFLALEWDDTEVRVAVAASRGEAVLIEHAFSVPLRPGQPGVDQAEVNVGERIATALAARGLGRLEALVAVGRANIELRRLSLPPAPDEELPELVRFQAERELASLSENWPLDFVPLEDAADQPRHVLAAAIDPELVSQIQQTCQTAGLRPRRLVLRPCAAASLLWRSALPGPGQVRLLVDVLVDEADLTAMVGRKVIFIRTARLPGDPLADGGPSRALLAEIRRTIAAVQNQLDGQPVESIVLCGAGEKHTELAELIQRELSTPTELFDPFSGLKLSAELERGLPDYPGRFAPLLGGLLDELDGTPHAIDFLHPRRRPVPPSRRNTYVMAGLVVALLVAALFLGSSIYCRWLDGKIEALQAKSQSLEKDVADADKVKDAAARIERWNASDFCWLKELRWLSERFPSAKEAMITELQLRPTLRGGEIQGEMEIKGLAQDVEAIEQGEESVRDERHDVIGNEATEDKSHRHYSWRFSSSVFVSHQKLSHQKQ